MVKSHERSQHLFLTCLDKPHTQQYASDFSTAVRYDSDVDNTVEVILTGLKNFLYLPLDVIDWQCAIDTTADETNKKGKEKEDISVASNNESIAGYSVVGSIADNSQATVFGIKQKAKPVRGRRRRRIMRF